jgi:hypothetical protein
VLAALCFNKGWLATQEDLFSPVRSGRFGAKPGETVGKSKDGEVKCAKQKLDALKRQSANTLAAVAKLICDCDLVNGVRMIGNATRALHNDFKDMMVNMKGPESCAAYCTGWVKQSWLQALKDTLKAREDMPGLGRCGFTVRFPCDMLKRLSIDSPQVLYEDGLAKTFVLATQKLIACRAGSMSQWDCSYPFALAGVLSDDAATRRATMATLKQDCVAYWEAKEWAR